MMDMARHHILLLVCAVFYTMPQNAFNNASPNFKAIKPIYSKKALEEFRDSPNVRVVYYLKKDIPRLRFFFKELDKSAEYLDLYGVEIGMVDCNTAVKTGIYECTRDKVEQHIYTYRNGQSLLSLELETMFDVNSVMSNILQLVLLRQVPILQTTDEVKAYLEKYKGKFDVIFGNMKAIGTFDHRVFMEVAYAYQDKFKFAICTERKATAMFHDVPHDEDKSIIWWIWTKETSHDDTDYHSAQYRDELNLSAFAKFALAISLPKMFDIPSDGPEDPYTALDMSSVRLYYDAATKADIVDKANLIARHYLGTLTITLYDMDREENKGVLSESQRIPALSFSSKILNQPLFMKKALTADNIATFLEDALIRVTPESMDSTPDYESSQMDDNKDIRNMPSDINIEAVETQDDHVADAVYMTKNIKMPLNLVPAFTDKTFPTSLVSADTVVITFDFPYKTFPTSLVSADTVVITFYFSFDALSMAFLRMFGEAADLLGAGTGIGLGRVNCHDWTDVCALQNISIYPTMRVFRHGVMDWDYRGPMDTQEIYSTLKILDLSPPVHLQSQQDVMVYLTGSASIAQTITNVTVVGLFDKKHTHERNLFAEAARENRRRVVFADTDIPEAADIAIQMGTSLPAIILAKYDDTIQTHVVFKSEFTTANIHQFVQDNRLPKLAKLTPLMFPDLRARGHDFVILFTNDTPKCLATEDSLREIVKADQFNNISFTLMPVPSMVSVGFKVLSQYTEDPSLPFISYVDLNKGEVFNFEQSDFHKDIVSKWIGSVVNRSLQPSTVFTVGEWQPAHKDYEFLRIIDWQKKSARKKESEGQKKGRISKETVQDTPVESDEDIAESDSVGDDDNSVRMELFELHSSRFYHHHSADREKAAKHGENHGEKSEMKMESTKLDHTEL